MPFQRHRQQLLLLRRLHSSHLTVTLKGLKGDTPWKRPQGNASGHSGNCKNEFSNCELRKKKKGLGVILPQRLELHQNVREHIKEQMSKGFEPFENMSI